MALAPPAVTDASRPDFTRGQWIALLFVVCCAFSSQMVMPLWVGAVIDDTGLSEAAVGRIGSLEFLAVAAVSVLVALRIQLFPTRRTAALGVALLVIGNVAAAWADRELTLTLARMLCGIGKGLVVAIAFSLAAGSPRPTRAFAVLNITYALFSTFFYLTVPYAIQWEGAAGAFLSMAGVAVAGALFMPGFPKDRLAASEISGLSLRALPAFGFIAFAALIILWSGNNVVWTFIARIGARDGLDVTAIGRVLSLSAFITIAGPSLARAVDTRFGYRLPMIAATALLIVTVLVIGYVSAPASFTVAACAFMLLPLFVTPYVMGLLSLADPAGRLAAASSAAMTAGSSLGAWIGGMAIAAGYGWTSTGWVGAALALGGLAIWIVAVLDSRR